METKVPRPVGQVLSAAWSNRVFRWPPSRGSSGASFSLRGAFLRIRPMPLGRRQTLFVSLSAGIASPLWPSCLQPGFSRPICHAPTLGSPRPSSPNDARSRSLASSGGWPRCAPFIAGHPPYATNESENLPNNLFAQGVSCTGKQQCPGPNDYPLLCVSLSLFSRVVNVTTHNRQTTPDLTVPCEVGRDTTTGCK